MSLPLTFHTDPHLADGSVVICSFCALVSDLLSTLIVILARQNLQSAEIDASYMWGLIDQSFLVGDSCYFLMTFSSAVDRLKAVCKSIENMSLGHRAYVSILALLDCVVSNVCCCRHYTYLAALRSSGP